MKINLHAGHNPDGMIACGAIGLMKESTEARRVVKELKALLQKQGHDVYDCTVNNGTSQADVLRKIVETCNTRKVDLDISIHFNAGAYDKLGNGRTTGTEAFVYDINSAAYPYAEKVCDEISKLGFRNRGVKIHKNLYFLKNTKAPAMLIECLFVDDKDDVTLYNVNKMAEAIAEAIAEPEIVLDARKMLDKLIIGSNIKTPEYWQNAIEFMPYFDGFIKALYEKYEN